MSLLQVNDLKTCFDTDAGLVKAVDGVSFSVEKGETLGIVGESGCGKSVLSLSIMRLLPEPGGFVAGGDILFEGTNLLRLDEDAVCSVRGNRISMIFQEPMTSLNPVMTVGEQIMEPLIVHRGMTQRSAFDETVGMLRRVRIAEPVQRMREYPHQLSGGMRQRVMIAMALVCNPSLLIADEPTTALDVTVQAQILRLMNDLKSLTGSSIIFITHDLGVIAQMAERVMVMYAGRAVENRDVEALFREPLHPYTRGLLRSIPLFCEKQDRLSVIPGVVPSPLKKIDGCKFHSRCDYAFDRCRREEPPLFRPGTGESVRCWLHENGKHDFTEDRRPLKSSDGRK
ncbi:MAG: ABC transporter ATP-binding protein [Synergistaceae bacterium]|jgi:peptide/nickel transport system ATP-binding protein/oligopeptide transport system ATP-binding protein|nr:ABC transporter ATP-binding protein [Synergistaceae bacterium]